MKVAIVHDWLTGMRGGERCLEVFCELFPDAEIYTLLHVKGTVSSTIEKHPIRTSFLQRLPFSATSYRFYLPIFPLAIESFTLPAVDLILSSSHCVAKGVRVPHGACHIAYLHTPMRYVWDQYESYFAKGRTGLLTRVVMQVIRRRLQRWDVSSCDRVHYFIANSMHVEDRIRRYYGRQAHVAYPPVDFHSFSVSSRNDGFYLMLTAFAPYKRVDLALEAANRSGFRLKVIGSGQDERRLRCMAGPTVQMLGWQPDPVVRDHYARCKALIFPGEEDFGIVPLEAMACGKPVIAYGKGGALETVVPLNPLTESGSGPGSSNLEHPTGVFFYEQTVDALIGAVERFEHNQDRFDPQAIRMHVEPFDRSHFKERMREMITRSYEEFRHTRSC